MLKDVTLMKVKEMYIQEIAIPAPYQCVLLAVRNKIYLEFSPTINMLRIDLIPRIRKQASQNFFRMTLGW